MRQFAIALACGAALLSIPAFAQDQTASASFIDTEGQEVGTATLTQTDAGVEIEANLTGISEGEHGFHIHQTGDCDPSSAFESAGGHFAPDGNQHGFDNPEGPHAGDMENQMADADGVLAFTVTNDRVSLTEGEDGYLFDDDGSALMVHSGADDYETDPGGDAGDRIACGVIEASNGL